LTLNKVPINKCHLEIFFNGVSNLKSLLNPKDYQNVPMAVELLKAIVQEAEQFDLSGYQPTISNNVNLELIALAEICDSLLSISQQPKIDLGTQLLKLSKLAHLLLFIYRKHLTKFVHNSLYLDIQAIVQDAFIAAAYYKIIEPNTQLYLYQLGTDQLEQLLSSIRTITQAKNCDFLELHDRLRMAGQIESIYAKNPDWKKPSKLGQSNEIILDRCTVANWSGNLSTSSCQLGLIWATGARHARQLLVNLGFTANDLLIDDPDKTMLNPFGYPL
jgi:hypothetical protein